MIHTAIRTPGRKFPFPKIMSSTPFYLYSCPYVGKTHAHGELKGYRVRSVDNRPPSGTQEALLLSQPGALMHLFDLSPGFVALLTGPQHRFDYCNPAYLELIGGRDIVGMTVAEALPEVAAQGFIGLLDEVYGSGEALQFEDARYDRPLDAGEPVSELHIDFVLQPVFDAEGRVGGILVQGNDITPRVTAAQAVFDARRAAEAAETAQSEFVRRLSHDIRSPMNAVVSLASILASTHPLSSEQREYVRLLMVSADSVLAQVSDIVDEARIEARIIDLDSIAFSPAEVIQDVAAVLAAPALNKNLDLLVDDGGEGIQVIGDPLRLRQIITHLTANAIHFTEHGKVALSVRYEPGDMPGTTAVAIDVADTGPGMDAALLDALFEGAAPAHRRDYDEGRFSLTMAKTLAEMMGGTISVRSAAGKGTTFTLNLVLSAVGWDAPEEPAADESDEDPVSLSNLPPILLVEDYEPNILVATTFLKRFGFRVDIAANGRDAVEKARANDYLLALMDVQMPGINGLEATKLIRKAEARNGSPHLPIIGVTAYALAADRERCLAAGMDSFLSKPFTAADLHERIKSVMASSEVAKAG